MAPNNRSKSNFELAGEAHSEEIGADDVPTKDEILDDIGEGYRFVMSGGKGQPISDMHREIVEELAREELEENADIRL